MMIEHVNNDPLLDDFLKILGDMNPGDGTSAADTLS